MAYKLQRRRSGGRHGASGEQYIAYALTVPNDIAEQIPDGLEFEVELREEGILFRPVRHERPSWIRSP